MFFAPSERSVQQTVKNLSLPSVPAFINLFHFAYSNYQKKQNHLQLCPSLITSETIVSYVFGYLCLWYFCPLKSKQILSLLVVLPGQHFIWASTAILNHSTHPSNSSPPPPSTLLTTTHTFHPSPGPFLNLKWSSSPSQTGKPSIVLPGQPWSQLPCTLNTSALPERGETYKNHKNEFLLYCACVIPWVL